MSSTFPIGRARDVNRAVLTATLVFGIAGAGVMAAWAVEAGSTVAMTAGLVYGVTLAACALFSFLYHMLEGSPRRRLLRLLDHAAIFLLIAGTYTPFAAVALRGGGRLLAWVWGLALAGILGKLLLGNAYDRLFVAVYLGIGFLGVGSFGEAVAALEPATLALLAAGGAAYTVGALIYAKDIGRWTDPVWHVLVLLGKAAHFGAVALLLLH